MYFDRCIKVLKSYKKRNEKNISSATSKKKETFRNGLNSSFRLGNACEKTEIVPFSEINKK